MTYFFNNSIKTGWNEVRNYYIFPCKKNSSRILCNSVFTIYTNKPISSIGMEIISWTELTLILVLLFTYKNKWINCVVISKKVKYNDIFNVGFLIFLKRFPECLWSFGNYVKRACENGNDDSWNEAWKARMFGAWNLMDFRTLYNRNVKPRILQK